MIIKSFLGIPSLNRLVLVSDNFIILSLEKISSNRKENVKLDIRQKKQRV